MPQETDRELRERLLSLAEGYNYYQILVAEPHELDKIAERYGIKRIGTKAPQQLNGH